MKSMTVETKQNTNEPEYSGNNSISYNNSKNISNINSINSNSNSNSSNLFKRKKDLPLADVLLLPHIKQPSVVVSNHQTFSHPLAKGTRMFIPPRPRAKRFRDHQASLFYQETSAQALFVALYAGWAGFSIFTGSGGAGDVGLQRMLLMICMLGCLAWYMYY